MADDDQLPLQWDGEGNAPRDQVVTVQEEKKPSAQIPPTTPSRPARTRTPQSRAKGSAAATIGDLTGPIPGASAILAEIPGSANDADPAEPCSPDMLLNTHYPDQECPEQSSGSQEACLDGALRLNSRTLMGSTGNGDLPTANAPMTACAPSLPLCPECGSPKTWHILDAPADRFACLECGHHFNASTPGDVPSTPSQVSSQEVVQVASEGRPEDS
jgi:hypothetical protein